MSANANVLRSPEALKSQFQDAALRHSNALTKTKPWNSESFAREQIRGLVRRVFLSSGEGRARHIVFSAAEPQLDADAICEAVARTLSMETNSSIAWLDRSSSGESTYGQRRGGGSIKSCSAQLASNLWRLSIAEFSDSCREKAAKFHWPLFLAELRSEFEFAVIHGSSMAITTEAVFLGQLTDGIILVLGANSTRKTAARNLKVMLEDAKSRVIGTVLSERTFPIPESLYRRL